MRKFRLIIPECGFHTVNYAKRTFFMNRLYDMCKASPSVLQSSKMSSDTKDQVLFKDVDCKGVITLNRPKALNSLTPYMVDKMYSVLQNWQKEKKLILLKGML